MCDEYVGRITQLLKKDTVENKFVVNHYTYKKSALDTCPKSAAYYLSFYFLF